MKPFTSLALLAFIAAAHAAPSNAQMEDFLAQASARLDSMPDYAGSTTLGKDDVPVSVSGDITIRLKNSHYTQIPSLLRTERGRTQMDAFVNMTLGVFPNSYVNLWTILNLPFDFTGYYSNDEASMPYSSVPYNHMERVPFRHHQDFYGATLWEELTVGIDVRGGSFGAMAKLGGVLWVNSSPFTVWDRDPMPRFASVYETFEEERTVGTYYKEKTFQPVKEGGRAFWTNRSFGGFMLDVYNMPFDMSGHILVAQPKDADLGTRDGLRLLAGQPGDAEMSGSLDFRGDVYQGRLAKDKLGNLTLGANYLYMGHDKGLINENEFGVTAGKLVDQPPYFINSHVASLDLKGNITPQLMIHTDVAMAIDDTIKFRQNTTRTLQYVQNDFVNSTSELGANSFAYYAKIQSKHWEPITSEIIYVPKGWFSPFAFTDDSRNRTWRKDEFYVNSGNMRYHQNLMGMNLKFEPELNRGRFDVQYSQHKQIDAGLDVIAFEYRLNGRNLWESVMSWSKYNSALPLDSGAAVNTRYQARMGVPTQDLKQNYQRGGLRGGTWETWEVFVPFASADDAYNGVVPSSEKWATTLSLDMAYDIGHWIGYERNVQLGVYTALSGVSRAMAPLAYSETQSDMIMWSWFVNSEPAIALTDKFLFIGLFGLEMFRAPQAFVMQDLGIPVRNYRSLAGRQYIERAAINYLETSVGFGFDWDYASRAGLHFRYRYATHQDETFKANDWAGHYVHAESKVWF